ncbi:MULTISPECIES: hypothetical protein [unclassified Sinorhizobium]|uniref:hypothetical protein n=1 Tax=unclassified Sinorhizobium TaxID=2613772 RepID=UPI003525F172
MTYEAILKAREIGRRDMGMVRDAVALSAAREPVIPNPRKSYNAATDAEPLMVEGYGALPAANDNVPVATQPALIAKADEGGALPVAWSWHDAEQRRGEYIETYTGRAFFPMDPRPEEVFIGDIAHALSLQCRFAGHCHRFYSVAEHCVLLARHLRWEGVDVALYALLHDASETYLVDVPRPVKPYLPGYIEAEAKVMAAVAARFGLPPEMPAVVHDADNRIIADELVNMTPMEWHGRYDKPLGVSLRYWSPETAEEEFLETFKALMDCRARGME